jgi:hypothetical protein
VTAPLAGGYAEAAGASLGLALALAVLAVGFAAGAAYPGDLAEVHGDVVQIAMIAAWLGLTLVGIGAGWEVPPGDALGAMQAANGVYAGLLGARAARVLWARGAGGRSWMAPMPGVPALALFASALALAVGVLRAISLATA